MKKKILIVLTLFLLSNFCFAGIVVQNGIIPLGFDIEYDEDCFRVDNPKKFSCDYLMELASLNGSLMWEFNSKNTETPFHFMTGIELGFSRHGFLSMSFPMVFEFTLAKFEKTMIELQVNPNFGIAYGIKGGECFFYSPSIDVTFGGKDRKWVYGGVGIGSEGTFTAVQYKDFGNDVYIGATVGLHLFVGVRFPTW